MKYAERKIVIDGKENSRGCLGRRERKREGGEREWVGEKKNTQVSARGDERPTET